MVEDFDIIGEVIEASTTEFLAESRELHSPPSFGSFVRIGASLREGDRATGRGGELEEDPFDPFRRAAGSFGSGYRSVVEGESAESPASADGAIYGVVYQAATAPVDSSRRLRAFWKDEEQLNAEQPELSEWLLVTHFRAIIIGHAADGFVHQFLPPQPPKILSHVSLCAKDEIRRITSRMDFLRTLANFRNAPTEEVVAACIRTADDARNGDFNFLVSAGKELASLLKDDYDRLQAIMRRVAP